VASPSVLRRLHFLCRLILACHHPSHPQGYARKGAALHGMDRWGEAIAAYEAGLKMEPGSKMLEQGIEDARRRHMLAGGEWKFLANRRVESDEGGTEMLLKVPSVLAPAPSGGLCVLDADRNVVRIFSAGASHVRASLNTAQEINRASLFGQPKGLACDGAHVFVTDQMRCRVLMCSVADGSFLRATEGRSGSQDGQFDQPHGLALVSAPPSGTSGGEAGGEAGGEGGSRTGSAAALDVGSENLLSGSLLFVADTKNHRIVALSAEDLSFRYTFGRWGFGDGELIEPLGIAAHGDRLLVADSGNKRLCLFTRAGRFIRAMGPEGERSTFTFRPEHVALTDGAAFAIERPVSHDDAVPGRVHVLSPDSGAKLRPPLQPPFSSNQKGQGLLNGVAVFHDSLYISTGSGMVMELPRS
jgi:sugar lactone lactonase YvrE